MAKGTRKPSKSKKTTRSNKTGKAGKKADSHEQEVTPIIAAVIEAGFLAAKTDSHVSDEELQAIVQIIHEMCDEDLSVGQIRTVLLECNEAFGDGDYSARMAQIAARLPDNESREQALLMAAVVILSDGEYEAENEGQYFLDLAGALGVTRRTATSIWRDAWEAYS